MSREFAQSRMLKHKGQTLIAFRQGLKAEQQNDRVEVAQDKMFGMQLKFPA